MSEHDQRPARLFASLGAGTALASVAVAVGLAVQAGPPDSLPRAQAAPETSTTTATATATATTSATVTTSPSATSSSGATYTADKQGYVNTAARCDDKQTLMAYGRTERSLVAICVDPDGALEYRGVRLSDKSSLTIPATRGANGTLVASNDGVTYSVSPTVFLVSEGDNVIYRDSWIEFQQPRFPAGTPSSSATASTTAPTTAVSTTTVTVTATPTSKAAG
ncbi:MAG: hypothetical protein KDB72_13760 [Mycobacterium sp.]|nr:hypothetical protein [Mycobacterium sp.]